MNRYVSLIAFALCAIQATSAQEPAKRKPVTPDDIRIKLPVPRDFKPVTTVVVDDFVKIELVSAARKDFLFSKRTVSGLSEFSGGEKLVAKVKITNIGLKTINFTPWHLPSNKDLPSGKDEFKNEFSSWQSSVASWPSGGIEKATAIKIDEKRIDVVAFDRPAWLAEEIDLILPLKNLGRNGDAKFKIGRAFFDNAEKRKKEIVATVAAAIKAEEDRLDRIQARNLEEKAKQDESERLAKIAAAAAAAAAAEKAAEAKLSLVEIGDFKIRIAGVRGKMPMIDVVRMQDTVSQKDLLGLVIAIENTTETTLHRYMPWTTKPLRFDDPIPTLKDEFGNRYALFRPSFGLKFDGQLAKITRVDPQKKIVDMIFFDTPIERATELTISLPRENIGIGRGEPITFKVPASFFKAK
jgi:hypothetical protein